MVLVLGWLIFGYFTARQIAKPKAQKVIRRLLESWLRFIATDSAEPRMTPLQKPAKASSNFFMIFMSDGEKGWRQSNSIRHGIPIV